MAKLSPLNPGDVVKTVNGMLYLVVTQEVLIAMIPACKGVELKGRLALVRPIADEGAPYVWNPMNYDDPSFGRWSIDLVHRMPSHLIERNTEGIESD